MFTGDDWVEIERLAYSGPLNNHDYAEQARRYLPLVVKELQRLANVEGKMARFAQAVGTKRIEELEAELEMKDHAIDLLVDQLSRMRGAK